VNPVVDFLTLLIILAVVGVIGAAITWLSHRPGRDNKSVVRELTNARQQISVLRTALIKIAANDSGNPALEAQIALDDLSRLELKALESK